MSLITDIIKRGTRGLQPLATAVSAGTLYYVTDETLTERSTGAAWESYSPTVVGSPWALVASFTSTSGATHDFTGLSAYNEIMVTFEGVATAGSSLLQILVSTDNGGTFKTASGDYLNMTDTMIPTNATSISCHNTSTANARTGAFIISLFNKTQYKPFYPVGHLSATNLPGMITVASALNAIRVQPNTAAATTFSAGTIRVWGR